MNYYLKCIQIKLLWKFIRRKCFKVEIDFVESYELNHLYNLDFESNFEDEVDYNFR